MPIYDDRPLAYSYLRFSTPEQSLGDSARRQLQGARDCAERRNLRLDESLRDEGVSAFRGKNREGAAALGSFLQSVQTGRIAKGSYLIVESLDRLSRQEVILALELFLSIIKAGIIIITLSDDREYSTESLKKDQLQLFFSLMTMARSHEESALKSERVGKAWSAKRTLARETGQAMTGRTPAWIRLIGGPKSGKYELIPERAAVVSEIFQLTIKGLGRRTIQRQLNDRQEPTWGTPKKKDDAFWQDSYIAKILSSPAAYGAFAHAKVTIDKGADAGLIRGYFPAVISEDTYWAARAAAKIRGSGRGTPGARRNLLSGLIKCEACSRNMVYVQKDKGRVRCGRAHASGPCDQRQWYDYARIELKVLFALGLHTPSLANSDATAEAVQRKRAVEAKKNAVEVQLKNLIEVAMHTSSKAVAAQIDVLEAQDDILKSELIQLEVKIREQSAVQIEARAAADAVVTVYQRLREFQGEELTVARAQLAQKLKFLIKQIELGLSGIRIAHSDGEETRIQII